MGLRLLLGLLAAAAVLRPVPLSAQTPAPPATAAPIHANAWSWSIVADGYFVPDSSSYVSPTVTADRGRLHFESRYNYEDRSTGSLWFGCNFTVGENLTLEATPMIGAVFGTTAGVAPGYQLTLSFRRWSLSDTGEYVFDLEDRSRSFFYAWPQVTYSPMDWLKVGIAAQRTKAYHSDYNIQRGALIGVVLGRAEFTSYIFAGHPTPTVVLEGSFSF